MTSIDPHTRFGYLLEQYDLPQGAFGIRADDSDSWLFVDEVGFLSEGDFDRWRQCMEQNGAEWLEEQEKSAFPISELPDEHPERTIEEQSEQPDAQARFINLLDELDLPPGAFSLDVDHQKGWLNVTKLGFLDSDDFDVWRDFRDHYATATPNDKPHAIFSIADLPQAPSELDIDGGSMQTELPETTMSTESLEDAHRMLTGIQDVQLEEDGEVSSWVLAARRAVSMQLSQKHDD
jgi:hypothetical protein